MTKWKIGATITALTAALALVFVTAAGAPNNPKPPRPSPQPPPVQPAPPPGPPSVCKDGLPPTPGEVRSILTTIVRGHRSRPRRRRPHRLSSSSAATQA